MKFKFFLNVSLRKSQTSKRDDGRFIDTAGFAWARINNHEPELAVPWLKSVFEIQR